MVEKIVVKISTFFLIKIHEHFSNKVRDVLMDEMGLQSEARKSMLVMVSKWLR